jgi:hypothetical protein
MRMLNENIFVGVGFAPTRLAEFGEISGGNESRPYTTSYRNAQLFVSLGVCRRTPFLEAVGKCSDARHPSLYKPQAQILRNEAYLPVRRSDEE